ncbi:hypothetical protein [Lichenifustis flavocetrariae]|uniref:Uncharacterized protein n=1 Tax=Lichenifustis flavocetrariae TaxID=2949735 RepID=A0AA41YXJ6_9HYPH|nr:hypothetical protein [Lichenifustis flavocetrariae]MCW6509022.1 hypothetical protein [Lichenifustis flavocetrariae]
MTNLTRTAGIALTAATILASASQAFAQPYGYDAGGNPPVVYAAPPPLAGHPLTVARRPTYNPYEGPKAVVTAPIYVASELTALPFRVVNSIFPADPRSPLAIVGAPVYAAGQIAQIPFHVIQAPFGDRAIYGQ